MGTYQGHLGVTARTVEHLDHGVFERGSRRKRARVKRLFGNPVRVFVQARQQSCSLRARQGVELVQREVRWAHGLSCVGCWAWAV